MAKVSENWDSGTCHLLFEILKAIGILELKTDVMQSKFLTA